MPWVKGQSGNPGGRPGVPQGVRELAREKSVEAMRTLIRHLKDKNPRVAILAANAILDRAYGKPAQAITGEDGEGAARLVIEVVRFGAQTENPE